MTVSGNTFVRSIREAGLPDILRDVDLDHLISGTSARRHGLVKRALAKGDLLQIRRGLYTLSDVYRRAKIHPFELAQWIYGPSYVSFESALSHWDLIPEAVHTITNGTSRRSKEFETPHGTFAFVRIPYIPLFTEVKRIEDQGAFFFLAKPLRAMADYVYISGKDWTLKNLAESLRMENVPKVDRKAVSTLRKFYLNQRVVRFLDSCRETYHGR